jgi:hypothetical protein
MIHANSDGIALNYSLCCNRVTVAWVWESCPGDPHRDVVKQLSYNMETSTLSPSLPSITMFSSLFIAWQFTSWLSEAEKSHLAEASMSTLLGQSHSRFIPAKSALYCLRCYFVGSSPVP